MDLNGMTHALGLGGSWQVLDQSWVPSISVGWGINLSDSSQNGDFQTSQSWTAGFEWNNIFNDGQFIWEARLQLIVKDAITVTQALFNLSRPLGQNTPKGETFQQLGGLAKITFSF